MVVPLEYFVVVVFPSRVSVSLEAAAVAAAILMLASPMLCVIANVLVALPVVVTAAIWRSCAFSKADVFWLAAGVHPATTFAKECPESFVNRA